jgi:hypothetical protein
MYAIFSLLIAFSHDSGGVITFTFPTHFLCVSAIVQSDSRVTGHCHPIVHVTYCPCDTIVLVTSIVLVTPLFSFTI